MKTNRCLFAFTLLELLVVVALIALLTALAVPGYRRYLESSRGQRCSANILLLETAKDSFVADHPGQAIASPDDLVPYLKYGLPGCPSGGSYSNITDRYARVTCSAKVGGTLNGLHDYGKP